SARPRIDPARRAAGGNRDRFPGGAVLPLAAAPDAAGIPVVTGGASLALEKVDFAYAAHPVLAGLSVRLAAGEMVALLGRNGSGKSTLLNLVAGVLRPRAGRIFLEGRELSDFSPRERARRVAMVPQMLSLSVAFTVRELVSLGRTPYLSPLRGERA